MKKFLELVHRTSRDIDTLGHTLKRMDGTTRKVSGAAFESESEKLRDTLAADRDNFIEVANSAKANVQNLKTQLKTCKSQRERHQYQQHINSLVERLQRAIEHFSTSQSDFGSEERHRLKSQYIIARPTATEEEIDAAEYGDQEDTKNAFSIGAGMEKAQHRKKSLQHIASGIAEVTQMTQQLNLLVHDTDKEIDKVSVTTSHTEKKAKKADADLKKALRYQKLTRILKILCFSILGLLVLAGLLALLGTFILLVLQIAINRRAASESGEPGDADSAGGSAGGGSGGSGGASAGDNTNQIDTTTGGGTGNPDTTGTTGIVNTNANQIDNTTGNPNTANTNPGNNNQ